MCGATAGLSRRCPPPADHQDAHPVQEHGAAAATWLRAGRAARSPLQGGAALAACCQTRRQTASWGVCILYNRFKETPSRPPQALGFTPARQRQLGLDTVLLHPVFRRQRGPATAQRGQARPPPPPPPPLPRPALLPRAPPTHPGTAPQPPALCAGVDARHPSVVPAIREEGVLPYRAFGPSMFSARRHLALAYEQIKAEISRRRRRARGRGGGGAGGRPTAPRLLSSSASKVCAILGTHPPRPAPACSSPRAGVLARSSPPQHGGRHSRIIQSTARAMTEVSSRHKRWSSLRRPHAHALRGMWARAAPARAAAS